MWKSFFWEAGLFLLTLALGIVTAFKLKDSLLIQEESMPTISFWQFLLYFALTTVFIALISSLIKQKKAKTVIYKIIFIFATLWAGTIVLAILVPPIAALILMCFFLLWWLKKPSVFIHNLCMLLGIAGAGSILGTMLDPLVVILLLAILSIYDFIAVYKTKHMQRIAKEMAESKAIMAFIIPPQFADIKTSLRKVKLGGKFFILGGGDIAFPLVLAASLVPQGMSSVLIVSFFAFLGLFISFLIFAFQRVRQPMPALPPIALFSIIGFLITLII